MLRLFVNAFTADDKCSLPNIGNLAEGIQIKISQKQNLFLNFFLCSKT